MFDVEVVRAALSLTDQLRHAAHLRRRADSVEVQAIADLAAEQGWSAASEFDVVGERLVRIGADGTPLVGEFLALEVAAVREVSVTAATCLIRDVVNLKHRHPVLWLSVIEGDVASFRAFQLVRLCADQELTAEEAAIVEGKLARRYGRVSWPRIMRLARGLCASVAADRLAARVEAARRERFVRTEPATDEPLVSHLWGRIDTADAEQLEATLSAVAKALAAGGNPDSLEVRRAKALGMLASPARALALLETGVEEDRYRPRATVYLHLSDDQLTRPGVARAERLGPIPTAQLKNLFGAHRIHVTPVVRVGGEPVVDAYEVPDRLRAAVTIRDVCEVFPWSSRPARGLDLDHTVPFAPGGEGQTRQDNLGPLTRRVHRAKTARLWHLEQLRSGIFHWRSPRGQRYQVGPDGTASYVDTGPFEVLVADRLSRGEGA